MNLIQEINQTFVSGKKESACFRICIIITDITKLYNKCRFVVNKINTLCSRVFRYCQNNLNIVKYFLLIF